AIETMQPMAQQHGIMLVDRSADVQLWVDTDYILQALTNLISNAIKFSAAGSTVCLTVTCLEPPPPERKSTKSKSAKTRPQAKIVGETPSALMDVLFQVADEGQGIPALKLESIFERFQQVDSSDSRKKGGTGLGLTICRKIIEQHGGKIWVDSTLGVGSTFSFTVPTRKLFKSSDLHQ
ncbi:ATP-binding protein, partial [Chamaesiphon sp. VAR_48_metabat_403]|uniref:sensor histidine kinase n=1 Tax=Chamaesiphon sp. VAR_48_metabat_403 TaxID=2964700 RepID=UPI00286E4917